MGSAEKIRGELGERDAPLAAEAAKVFVSLLLIQAALRLKKGFGAVYQFAAGETLVRAAELGAEAGDFVERPRGDRREGEMVGEVSGDGARGRLRCFESEDERDAAVAEPAGDNEE